MEETHSPRQRAPMLNRLRSPTTTTSFFVSNDDQLERAQARAIARAAAIIRSSTVASCFLILLLLPILALAKTRSSSCSKTASNSPPKTVGGVFDGQASCTLEAGVKIYSFRVDAVHADAYKVLDGILRAGLEDEQDAIVEGDNINGREERSHAHNKEESERKISPISTLESSFEALNVRKFDVAFAVDPLYHQTSAQFDEGGAKGLLLNNLGVYEGCRVLFDSFEVPGKCKSGSVQNNILEMIDISFAKESIEKMVINMLSKKEICPILKVIECHFGGDNQRSSETFDLGQKFDIRVDADDANEARFNYNSFGNYDPWTFDHDEVSSTVNEGSDLDPTFYDHHEESDTYASCESDLKDSFEDVANLLLRGLGFTSKQNAWAGPDHWKYHNHKGSQDIPATNVESALTTKKPKSKNLKEFDVDFTKYLEKEMLDVFVPPKNPKLLLLPANRASCNNTLPEDCRYQPESLVKLFLLPNIMCLGKRRRKRSDHSSWQQNDDFDEQLPSWDNESMLSSQFNNGCAHDDEGNLDDLISQPRQVNRIEVQYDKTSKQVDVHALKEKLWDHMLGSLEVAEVVNQVALSFKHVLATFLFNCQAAKPEDISPHLCFICLLHLANEHGLIIQDRPSLDDLSIHLPASASPRANL
ncbi:hypothetical protein PTKIN_Ptkin14bG0038400 [Pterospermum kingtungense]